MFDEIQDVQQMPHIGTILGADPVLWQWDGTLQLGWLHVETIGAGYEMTAGAARPVGTAVWMSQDSGTLAYLRWKWVCAPGHGSIEFDPWSIETNLRLCDAEGALLPAAHARYVLARMICVLDWQQMVVATLKN